MSRLALASAVAVLLSAGCSHGSKRSVDPCARARAEAIERIGQHALRGDVDGDGVRDSVALVRVRSAPARCGAFLVVRTRGRTLVRALRTTSYPRVPSLNGLAALGSRRGLGIVVTTWQGASTAFARVYAVAANRISPVAAGTPDGTFPYEGSVTHFNAIDCTGKLVVASGWFERGASRFGFYRRFYRVRDGRFALVRSETGTSRSPVPGRHLREFREPQPFPSCMRVRATS
jgi:hypothetical protein